MISNLVFSLNATMPLFLMMVVGYVLRQTRYLDEHSTNTVNRLVFRIFLPALLFMDLAKEDYSTFWDTSFVVFCAIATIASIIISFVLALLVKDKADRGEFIQASYRSAAATLGIAFMANIYKQESMVSLMIIGSVPIYNIVAVMLLAMTAPKDVAASDNKKLLKGALIGVITNPIIISILLGMLWSMCKLPMPTIFSKSMTYLGSVASPLALIGLGASFEPQSASQKKGPIIAILFNKLFLFCILFLPVAIHMGFRNEKLVAALIMLGSATTSSSFIMAKNMGHKGVISSSSVILTTLFSAFSMTLWLFILRTLGYI